LSAGAAGHRRWAGGGLCIQDGIGAGAWLRWPSCSRPLCFPAPAGPGHARRPRAWARPEHPSRPAPPTCSARGKLKIVCSQPVAGAMGCVVSTMGSPGAAPLQLNATSKYASSAEMRPSRCAASRKGRLNARSWGTGAF
jgi:hypothetical protein